MIKLTKDAADDKPRVNTVRAIILFTVSHGIGCDFTSIQVAADVEIRAAALGSDKGDGVKTNKGEELGVYLHYEE